MTAVGVRLPEWTEDAGSEPSSVRARPQLRAVPRRAARLERLPFLGVLMAVFGVGLAGLLMLNTTLQNQTFQGRALTREATELAHTQADLERQLDAVSAPYELARRASALGLRPNPHPAFLVLPSGEILGKPVPATGREIPGMVIKTPAEKAAHRAKVAAKKAEKAAKKKAEQKTAAEEAARAAAAKKAEQQAAAQRAAAAQAAARKAAPAPRPPSPVPAPAPAEG